MIVEHGSETAALERHRLRRGMAIFCALALLGLFRAPGVGAQEAEDPPALGIGGERSAGIQRVAPEDAAGELVDPGDLDGRRPRVFVPYHVAPWYWYGPQTYRGVLPPAAEDEPRLGVRYYDGFRMGIRVPADAEPPYTYSLGPYRGVVRSPQRPEWLHGPGDGEGDEYDEASQAIALLRDGQYRAAGGRLAEGFRQTDDPRYPLLLAEVLFALGEHKHADLLLRHALEQEGVFQVIPDDAASHFPSREVYREKLQELRSSENPPRLLTAYLLLFSEDATEGLDMLVELMGDKRAGDTARRLYRHFLGKAFGGTEETEEKEPPGGGGEEAEETKS